MSHYFHCKARKLVTIKLNYWGIFRGHIVLKNKLFSIISVKTVNMRKIYIDFVRCILSLCIFTSTISFTKILNINMA